MSVLAHLLALLVAANLSRAVLGQQPVDPKGYMTFCPCMGRFGNQADHYLGALAFAKKLDRTLILPPWVEYVAGRAKSAQAPFSKYFNVTEVGKYHRVVTSGHFFGTLAAEVWPQDKRFSFCYSARLGSEKDACNAKEGNPFGPFWDSLKVDFVGSKLYKPLTYESSKHSWNEKFPVQDWPVLAFTGAPATFPIQENHLELHQYLVWNDKMLTRAKDWISKNLPKGKFVGVHMRNGKDWERACQHVKDSPRLFSAAQCIGYDGEHGELSMEMCLPSQSTVLQQIAQAVERLKATAVFVASDSDHMIKELRGRLKQSEVTKLEDDDPHLDLVILGQSDHFIGNCVSSFSAFVKRERDSRQLPSSFWAFPPAGPRRKVEL